MMVMESFLERKVNSQDLALWAINVQIPRKED